MEPVCGVVARGAGADGHATLQRELTASSFGSDNFARSPKLEVTIRAASTAPYLDITVN